MKKFTAAIAGCSNYKPGANELDWGIAIMEGGGQGAGDTPYRA